MSLYHRHIFTKEQVFFAYKKASPTSYYFWKFWSERKAFGILITLGCLLIASIIFIQVEPIPANKLKLLVIQVSLILGGIMGTMLYAAPYLEAEKPEDLAEILSVPYRIEVSKRANEVVFKQLAPTIEESLVGPVIHELREYTMTKPMFNRFNKALKRCLLTQSLDQINSAPTSDNFV